MREDGEISGGGWKSIQGGKHFVIMDTTELTVSQKNRILSLLNISLLVTLQVIIVTLIGRSLLISYR